MVIFACSGILFNHESPLRPKRFVTQKIVSTACRIASGSDESLHLGNITIQRHWGWSSEYVRAMWLTLQQDRPEDYVVATGETHSLEEFVKTAFDAVRLDWHDHMVSDPAFFRASDLMYSGGNPDKIRRQLGWGAGLGMKQVVRKMVQDQRGKF